MIASAFYRLNVNKPMIRMMGQGHVYADPAWLDQTRMAEKVAVTNAPGARHASFRFVAGELDPMSSCELFLATTRRVTDPILVVYGAATPARSKAGRLLRDGGATKIDVIEEDGFQALRTPEDWWTIALGSGLRWAIDQMGPESAARMRTNNVNCLRENKIDRLEINAIYAIGYKGA